MDKKILTTVLSILIAVLGWVWTVVYMKLVNMEKELVSIKISLVEVQKDLLSKDDVRELIDIELTRRLK